MGEENDNSEKLLSFCVSHDPLIGGTWFRHQYTFSPTDQQMRKIILDHILFGWRHRVVCTTLGQGGERSLSSITKWSLLKCDSN